jgi:hypothetical protein
MARFCLTTLGDPGPCPVDDTPHTGCTPESYAAQQARDQTLTVKLRRPRVLDRATAPRAEAVPRDTFTTKTYKRREHGKRLGLEKGRR